MYWSLLVGLVSNSAVWGSFCKYQNIKVTALLRIVCALKENFFILKIRIALVLLVWLQFDEVSVAFMVLFACYVMFHCVARNYLNRLITTWGTETFCVSPREYKVLDWEPIVLLYYEVPCQNGYRWASLTEKGYIFSTGERVGSPDWRV